MVESVVFVTIMADDTESGQSPVSFKGLESSARGELQRKARRKVDSLSTEITKDISVGNPLPTEGILRYLTEAGLMEFQCSQGIERIKWYEQVLKTVKIEAMLRKKDADETENERQLAALKTLFVKASKRIDQRNAEDEAAEREAEAAAG